ncbi:MAG: ABC transporter substrate-binding protein [Roseburia sp.]|nr:ABC transporter substrate-binding protein [Roseburia sp.]
MKKKRFLALALALSMGLSLCACGGNSSNNADTSSTGDQSSNSAAADTGEVQESTTAVDDTEEELSYDDQSAKLYDEVFGEFYEYYQKAEDAGSVSERYALMAIAEAKMLESAVMLPLTTRGGNYAISRVAPGTLTPVLWGNDEYRFHQLLITTELITAEHRAEMKDKWSELRGTGEYEAWAKSYLEEKGYTIKDSYNYAYTTDPNTWDVLATSLQADTEPVVNTYDCLMEYDMEGTLQPRLAESYEVSADGLTYTFHIREGATWVDSQGRKVADVTADDFVAGMQHMMDAMGGLEFLVDGIIKNSTQYINQEITDFNEVGVKAVDERTLEYTLEAPCTYFISMFNYNVFAPLCRTYYESQGGKFGTEYDSSAADYTYGKDPDSIVYCGPYVITNATAKNTIVYKANESYWDKDNINIKEMTWLYNDGSDATKSYNDAIAGTLDGAGLNPSSLELARAEGNFDDYAYVSATVGTSYMAFYNINRAAFANFNDETKMVSPQTEDEAARTNAAINNVHFRRAISFALDKAAWNALYSGEELKLNSLRNSYTPGTFVTLEEDVTVDINGTATTFPAGTFYGTIMQAQIDADGVAILAFDKNADDGIGSSDGYDGWYHPEEAVEELNTAIEELAAQGVVIDEQNPIQLDLPYPISVESFTNRANAYKQSLEKVLGGKVVVNLIGGESTDDWYYAGYYPTYGYEGNYDVNDSSGWGPDYGDPSTYLNTLLPDYAGYMMKTIGIY